MANTRKRPWRVTWAGGTVTTYATRIAADRAARDPLYCGDKELTHRERPGHRVVYSDRGEGREQVWHQGMQRWVDG